MAVDNIDICPICDSGLQVVESFDGLDVDDSESDMDPDPVQGHLFECENDSCDHQSVLAIVQYPGVLHEGITVTSGREDRTCQCGLEPGWRIERAGSGPRYRCEYCIFEFYQSVHDFAVAKTKDF